MYYGTYKCRLCGEHFFNRGTSNKEIAFNVSMRTALGLKQKEIQSPTIIDIHICENGSFGMSDFIGM